MIVDGRAVKGSLADHQSSGTLYFEGIDARVSIGRSRLGRGTGG